MQDLVIHIHTGTSADGFSMKFVDATSGVVILRTKLTHEQLGKALGGFTSDDTFPATVIGARQANYLGAEAHHFARRFRYSDPALLEGLRKQDTPPILDLWASVVRSRCWAQSSRWSVNNERVITFHMTRWENDLTAEKLGEIQDCLHSHETPEGLVAL